MKIKNKLIGKIQSGHSSFVYEKAGGMFPRLVIGIKGNTVTSVFTDGSGLRNFHVSKLRLATIKEVTDDLSCLINGLQQCHVK